MDCRLRSAPGVKSAALANVPAAVVHLPELAFEQDDTEKTAERIENLIRKLHEDERG